MRMRREGSALWITDNGFYEPEPLPRAYGKSRATRRIAYISLAIAALLLIAAGLWGASH